jgi:hypothetical protein
MRFMTAIGEKPVLINSSYIPLNKHKTDVLGNIFKDSLSEIIEKALVQ